MNDSSPASVAAMHQKRFGARGVAYRAPGRVNLIGDHTDTSEGFVMPAALDLQTISVLSGGRDATVQIYSANFAEQVRFDLKALPARPRGHWSDYPAGVLWSLQNGGLHCEGFDMTLSGDVPPGAGLSSSASVEVAVAVAVLAYAGANWSRPQVARACQLAENDFVGTQSGIMDQFASCCGVKDHAILLDCRTLEYEPLPLPTEVVLVICNSMVKHSFADGGAYNQRRAEVQEGVGILHKRYADMRTLRDIDEGQLKACIDELPKHIFRRCLHVVTENWRVLQAAEALRNKDLAGFGRWMLEAHRSMRDDYEASCKEVDALVEIAMRQPGCLGARITGGGFGGCTVNLVAGQNAEAFCQNVRSEYRRFAGIDAEIYQSQSSDGAGPVGKHSRTTK